MARPDSEALVDAYGVCEPLGISPATVRSWVRRGRLKRAGVDAEGRSLYRYADLLSLAIAARRNRQQGDI